MMKSFFRFLSRNPYYTVINILGLSISLMFVILIGDYTWRQISMDSSQPKKDRIVALGDDSDLRSWPDISHQIGDKYPEIEKTCCIISHNGRIYSGEKEYEETEKKTIMLADSTIFDIFSFDFLNGDPATALSSPDKCVITKSFADSFFPGENPIGQSFTITGERGIRINDGKKDPYDSTLVYQVSAVIEDLDKTILPNETKIIANFSRSPQIMGYILNKNVYISGQYGYCKTFYLLKEKSDITAHAQEIGQEIKANAFSLNERSGITTFTPLRKLMLSPLSESSGLEHGDKGMIIILLSAMIAILVFAVTNYINLTVANTGLRAKEMATRQLLGSKQSETFHRLILESIFLVTASFIIGFALAFAFEGDASSIFKGRIMLENDITFGSVTVAILFIIATGSLAGIIPALQITSFKPIDVVKGTFRYKSKMVLGKIFLGVQNAVTVIMLSLSLVISLQINYLINAPLGINTKNVVCVRPANNTAIGSELDKLPCVLRRGCAYGSYLGPGASLLNVRTGTDGRQQLIYTAEVDKVTLDITGIEVLQNYENSAPLCNQTFFKEFGIPENSLEVQLQEETLTIGGVFKDFRKNNILDKIYPFMIQVKETSDIDFPYYVIETDGSKDAVQQITDVVSKFLPAEEMDGVVEDMDMLVAKAFDEYKEILVVVLIFTIIALIISVFGFIGMALFFTRQRKSEIAVRKVMGSTSSEVIGLMLRKFCTPLIISSLCALPIAYFIADKWIQDFSYRIALSPVIFLGACLIALVIAVVSILCQIIVAAKKNPADSIKTE